ncbi:hypothetical protein R3W88_014832 [Solanum pinnatisectum]|uniref:Uncharacterized protein n=1 Tax=Solanum pinnatisectum TaxID=50273 RepID=A0AAV9KV79_9SOLN|nr:hypothetical protein R3W88_014832 [Solanum pinnatisectum]
MRTSFSSAHSLFTRFSKQRRKGAQQVPRALCPTLGCPHTPLSCAIDLYLSP